MELLWISLWGKHKAIWASTPQKAAEELSPVSCSKPSEGERAGTKFKLLQPLDKSKLGCCLPAPPCVGKLAKSVCNPFIITES